MEEQKLTRRTDGMVVVRNKFGECTLPEAIYSEFRANDVNLPPYDELEAEA
jgi:hypothetical protein